MAGQTKASLTIFAVIASITVFYFLFSSAFPLGYGREIGEATDRFGLDADLVRAVIWTESKYREDAVSRAGASGLMQLMPETRAWASETSGIAADGSAASEINLGCWYLRYLLDLTGNETDALMSYNAGYANVSAWKRGDGTPFEETTAYVDRVNFARKIYRLL